MIEHTRLLFLIGYGGICLFSLAILVLVLVLLFYSCFVKVFRLISSQRENVDPTDVTMTASFHHLDYQPIDVTINQELRM